MGEAICCPDQNSWCYYFNENSSAPHLKTFFIGYFKQKNCRKFFWNTDLNSYPISCSSHQTTNLVFPNFFNEFFSTWAVEKENKLLVQNSFFFQFWTNKNFVFFFNLQTEKKSWKKLGITRLVVWYYLMSRTRYKRNIRITFTTKIPIWKAAELNTENYYIVQFIFKSAALKRKKNLEHFSNSWTRKTTCSRYQMYVPTIGIPNSSTPISVGSLLAFISKHSFRELHI
jgi:hypothetical protein